MTNYPNARNAARSAARVLVEQLVINGVDHVYTVPGESFLPVLDALAEFRHHRDGLPPGGRGGDDGGRLWQGHGTPRHLHGHPGPGATNASAGIHISQQDSTPVIMFVGQIERGQRDREAFQEMDYRAAFGPIAKWATEIDVAERVPEYVSRAFHTATSGRPGPVVVALPKDMLKETITAAPAAPWKPVEAAPARRTSSSSPPCSTRRRLPPAARRQPLERGGLPPDPAVRRCVGPAGRDQLPPPAAVPSAAPRLCRRSRPWGQPQARCPRQGGRPADRAGQPAR